MNLEILMFSELLVFRIIINKYLCSANERRSKYSLIYGFSIYNIPKYGDCNVVE